MPTTTQNPTPVLTTYRVVYAGTNGGEDRVAAEDFVAAARYAQERAALLGRGGPATVQSITAMPAGTPAWTVVR